MNDVQVRTMFQIQYVKNGLTMTIPIRYEELDDAKKDASVFKPGLEKHVINTKTKEIVFSIMSANSYPKFLNFTI